MALYDENMNTTSSEQVTIAGRTLTVTRGDNQYIELTGPRGAAYFLRGFLGDDTGLREIVSWKSGAELRDRCGRVVRVMVVGDVIEQVSA